MQSKKQIFRETGVSTRLMRLKVGIMGCLLRLSKGIELKYGTATRNPDRCKAALSNERSLPIRCKESVSDWTLHDCVSTNERSRAAYWLDLEWGQTFGPAFVERV